MKALKGENFSPPDNQKARKEKGQNASSPSAVLSQCAPSPLKLYLLEFHHFPEALLSPWIYLQQGAGGD